MLRPRRAVYEPQDLGPAAFEFLGAAVATNNHSGACCVCALVVGNAVHCANVGDSPSNVTAEHTPAH